MPEDFGRRLRRLRLERGLTQRELAGRRFSLSYISHLEAGRRTPTPEVLDYLAEVLSTSTFELLTGQAPRCTEDMELELRFAELSLLSGDAPEALHRFAELLATADGDSEGSPAATDQSGAAAGPNGEAIRRFARRARWGLARACEAVGDLEAAVRHLERLVDDPASDEPPWLLVVIAMCRCYREAGDLARSLDLGERARERLRDMQLEHTDLEVELLASLAAAYHFRDDRLRAQHLIEEATAAAESVGSRRALGAAYWNASVIARARGETALALTLAERALARYGEDSDSRQLGRLRCALAYLLLRQDTPAVDAALRQLDQAELALAETGSQVDLAYCDIERARALLLAGEVSASREAAERGLLRLGDEPRLEKAEALSVLAAIEVADDHREVALDRYTTAAQLLTETAACREAALVWSELADTLTALDEPGAALQAYRSAMSALGLAATAPQPARTTAATRAT